VILKQHISFIVLIKVNFFLNRDFCGYVSQKFQKTNER
jgi:hypothetical protein